MSKNSFMEIHSQIQDQELISITGGVVPVNIEKMKKYLIFI